MSEQPDYKMLMEEAYDQLARVEQERDAAIKLGDDARNDLLREIAALRAEAEALRGYYEAAEAYSASVAGSDGTAETGNLVTACHRRLQQARAALRAASGGRGNE